MKFVLLCILFWSSILLAQTSNFPRVNQDLLQRYATQGDCVGADWQPRPMEDPANVDLRRVEAGLKPLADYITNDMNPRCN